MSKSLLDNPIAQMQFDTNHTVVRTKVKVIVKDNHIATFATANDFSDGYKSVNEWIDLLTRSKYPVTLFGSICQEGPSKGKFVVNVTVKNVMVGWFNHPRGKEMSLSEADMDSLTKALKNKKTVYREVKTQAMNRAELDDIFAEISK